MHFTRLLWKQRRIRAKVRCTLVNENCDPAPPHALLHVYMHTSHPHTCQIGDKEAAICPQIQPVLEGLAFLHGLRAARCCWSCSEAPFPGTVRLHGLAQVLLQGSIWDIVCRPVDQVQWDDPKHSVTLQWAGSMAPESSSLHLKSTLLDPKGRPFQEQNSQLWAWRTARKGGSTLSSGKEMEASSILWGQWD